MSNVYQKLEPPETELRQLQEEQQKIRAQVQEFSIHTEELRNHIIKHLKEKIEPVVNIVVAKFKNNLLNAQRALPLEALRSLEVPVADIESNCEQFQHQLNAASQQACIQTSNGTYVPISENELTLNEFHYSQQRQNGSIENLSNDSAVDGFCNELAPFLSSRIIAQSLFPRALGVGFGASGSSSLLSINVYSSTHGARVSYTPAYFINYLALAAPTSPVRGDILPGRYMFMVSTNSSKLFDSALFDVPPRFDIHLTV